MFKTYRKAEKFLSWNYHNEEYKKFKIFKIFYFDEKSWKYKTGYCVSE